MCVLLVRFASATQANLLASKPLVEIPMNDPSSSPYTDRDDSLTKSPTPNQLELSDADLNDEAIRLAKEATDEAERLRQELAEAKRQGAFTASQLRRVTAENACRPLVISTSDIHPNELDIVVGTSPHQLLSNMSTILSRFCAGSLHTPFGFQLALIPVPIYPATVQDKPRPNAAINPRTQQPYVNHTLGESRIQASYATCTVLHDGIPTELSLSGFARLSLNTRSLGPNNASRVSQLHASLDSADNRNTFQLFGSGNYALDNPYDDGNGTFIPSLANARVQDMESNPSPDP